MRGIPNVLLACAAGLSCVVVASPVAEPAHLLRRQPPPLRINSTVEDGIQTECKKCPFSLCANVAAYTYKTDIVLTCWTDGTEVIGDTIWLKTTDGCYVTQWDIIEHIGDYTTDLPFCGTIPEEYTTTAGKTKYFTECNISPGLATDHIKMYKNEVDLTLTCMYVDLPDTGAGINDGVWFKTTSNCYVSQNLLHPVEGKDTIEDCGPIPFMEKKMREPDPEEEPETSSFSASSPAADIQERSTLKRRFLYETYVGEEYANCHLDHNPSSEVGKVFQYNDTVTPQCGTYEDGTVGSPIWLLTTDWCYVQDALMEPNLIDSVVRSENFPHCEYFVDTE
ncbi:hypothetical protein AJ80_00637 [Polytolypa hystricis UAMH7299]|uniref:Uncharacterized protein n=1 Tax=Polytolypa hystricis (strain UAMH7299) TaxID=1447883 RepID=A0A2B7YU91_POLH7|nr:hypothetical protein AJ80_00637 [Polytolypa hystricis UAMH7299]